jgi:carbamoyltransferase
MTLADVFVDNDTTYYLSTYLAPPGRDSILHSQRHDHSVALWCRRGRRIELVTYWELERFTGLKHHDLPLGTMEATTAVLDTLLAEQGLALADIAEIWGTPGISTCDHIERQFGSMDFPVHSLAHLYSAMLVDTETFHNSNIIGLAIDGGPDIALDQTNKELFYVGAFSVSGRIDYRPIESPGPLFIAAQERFGLAPGTLMALAESSTVGAGLHPPASAVDQRYLGGYGVYPKARTVIADLVPAAEAATAEFLATGQHSDLTRDELTASAAMKIVQELAEIIIRRNIEMLLSESGLDPARAHLALAGGVALNCPANSRMMRQFGFLSLLAPPCVDDSGQALGLGLLGLAAMSSPTSFDFALRHAFHGSRRVDAAAGLAQFQDRVVSTAALDHDQFVEDITRAPIGWVDGRSEIGPRALGHRSILADPRSPEAKSQLNIMKGRQWWRPVAPIVLVDFLDEWFEDPWPSPFMLQTFQVLQERRSIVPAITHIDGSARVQTIGSSDDDRLFGLLEHFYRVSGVPMLCNTSLNDRREPIVSSAADAINFCLRKGVSVIYLEGVRVELDTTPVDLPTGPRDRNSELVGSATKYRHAAWEEWLADGATEEIVFLLNRFPELRQLVEADHHASSLQSRFAPFVQQPALASNFADFLDEFGPGTTGSNRHMM